MKDYEYRLLDKQTGVQLLLSLVLGYPECTQLYVDVYQYFKTFYL